jgi:hypothetical protein
LQLDSRVTLLDALREHLDGAPFRLVSSGTGFVAPNWVWILGYTLFGLATGAGYWLVRLRGRTQA